MKQIVYVVLLTVIILLAGCRRNYKVVHARVPVDTTAHDDFDKIDEGQGQNLNDQPLIDVPDIPQENDFENVSSKDRKEYDDYMKGL